MSMDVADSRILVVDDRVAARSAEHVGLQSQRVTEQGPSGRRVRVRRAAAGHRCRGQADRLGAPDRTG